MPKLYAAQFHPEVAHTPFGKDLFENFLFEICGCKPDWILSDFAREQIEAIKATVGDKKVLCALSGGVDSSVAAILTQKAIGDNLRCIFVDHGLMRKNEGDQVMEVHRAVRPEGQARERPGRFLTKLAGVTDPERKRKIIGEEFIRVFEEEAGKLFRNQYLRFSAPGRSILTSLKAAPPPRRPSRATTMWAACPRMWNLLC